MSDLLHEAGLRASPDDVASAREDVAPYRGLGTRALWQHIVALSRLELQMRRQPGAREARARLDALDDVGRWWERVPESE